MSDYFEAYEMEVFEALVNTLRGIGEGITKTNETLDKLEDTLASRLGGIDESLNNRLVDIRDTLYLGGEK
jgi:hypothetical protein